jgi:rubrerythrin
MNTFELAITLENDMEKFYMEQAEKHSEDQLKQVFLMLADEERKHAKILSDNKELVTAPVEDKNIIEEAKKLFKDLADFKSEIKDLPSQLDSYRMALELEEKSLNLYKDLQEKDPERKEVYQYLVNQEDRHCIIMEELIKLTSRPEEWVESAEFGIREDY